MNVSKYLEQLFISKVRIKTLKYFFLNGEAIHLRAAVRELDEEINAVRRELSRMEAIKLLLAEHRGNRKYFRVNTDFLFYDELVSITNKSFGLGGEIIKNAKRIGEMKYALLTQGFTKNRPVGAHAMDLVIVGNDVNMMELDTYVTKEEQKLKRHINYTVLSERDYELRKRRKDAFIIELIHQDCVMLIGSKEEFIREG